MTRERQKTGNYIFGNRISILHLVWTYGTKLDINIDTEIVIL